MIILCKICARDKVKELKSYPFLKTNMEEVFYGVYIPPELLEGREEPVPTLYTSIVDVNKVGDTTYMY